MKIAKISAVMLAALLTLSSCQTSENNSQTESTDAPETSQSVQQVELGDNVIELVRADLNRDGADEIIAADISSYDTDGNAKLNVYASDGQTVIYSEDANRSHAGWNALYIYKDGTETALFRYLPQLSTGIGSYGWELFDLDKTGTVNSIASDAIGFELMGLKPFDAEGMSDFADTVNGYLEKCDTLLSTWNGELTYGLGGTITPEDYSVILNETPELYAEGDTLTVKLQKYSDNRLASLTDESGPVAALDENGQPFENQLTADEFKAKLNSDFGFRAPSDVAAMSDEELESYMSEAYMAAIEVFNWFQIDSGALYGRRSFSSSVDVTEEIDGKPYNNMYNPVFPTYASLEAYIRGLFDSEISNQLLSSDIFIDHNGELWGAMASRGTDIGVATTGYAVTSRSDTSVTYTAYADIKKYDEASGDFVTDHSESYDFIYSLTGDGWRWTQFSLYY